MIMMFGFSLLSSDMKRSIDTDWTTAGKQETSRINPSKDGFVAQSFQIPSLIHCELSIYFFARHALIFAQPE